MTSDAKVDAMTTPASKISVLASGKSVIALRMHFDAHLLEQLLLNLGQCGLPSVERHPSDERPISVAPWYVSKLKDIQYPYSLSSPLIGSPLIGAVCQIIGT